jgi:hypothetical protein
MGISLCYGSTFGASSVCCGLQRQAAGCVSPNEKTVFELRIAPSSGRMRFVATPKVRLKRPLLYH